MADRWTPLGMLPAMHDTLHPGVPAWMRSPLWSWIDGALYDGGGPEAIVQVYDSAIRNQQPYASRMEWTELEELITEADEVLRFVDFLLSMELGNSASLEQLLEIAGSEWRVGERDGFAGLERRMPEAVQVAVDVVVSSADSAGALLAEAWHAAFGREPDPSLAYSKSIKSVEEACIPAVLPNNPRATLGTVLTTLRQHADWRLPLGKEHAQTPSWQTVVDMCQSLWSGQTDRHGANNHRPPTQEEAETAVFLAVTLVQWFSSGAIQRRPAP